jgi:hypothetical protein
VQYAIVTAVPDYAEPTENRFTVENVAVEDGEWVGDGNPYYIERALGFEGYMESGSDDDPKDIRNWAPWPGIGAIVPVIQKWDDAQTTPAMRWYFDIDMLYGGPEEISSIRHNPAYLDPILAVAKNITQAVWV